MGEVRKASHKVAPGKLGRLRFPETLLNSVLNENIYDIEGHRVMTLGGDTIIIDIDGVAFDQLECDRLRRLGETKDTKDTKTNKFLIQLPPK